MIFLGYIWSPKGLQTIKLYHCESSKIITLLPRTLLQRTNTHLFAPLKPILHYSQLLHYKQQSHCVSKLTFILGRLVNGEASEKICVDTVKRPCL